MNPSSKTTTHSANLVMLVYLLGTVMGLVRFVIVTLQFGATDVLDAYYAAFRIPDLLFNVIAGGALGSAFIPVFAGLLARGETAKAWQVTSGVLNSLLFVVALLAELRYSPRGW
ncbi:MAG TPA: lipid II flippase MurJ [Anaerolineales bacterium]|nr:lipid II flippase MurJ [Anaerolineales bacterium]